MLSVLGPCARGAVRLDWPLRGRVLKGFQKPTGSYGEGGHQGIDIASSRGAVVRAAADGTVCWVGELPRGVFVSIDHGGGVRTTSLDLAGVLVRQGEKVSRGQIIAALCGTRDSSSPATHLHFDTYLNGSPVDPLMLMDGLDAASYIRLCPVERPGGSQTAARETTGPTSEGLWQLISRPVRSIARAFASGASTAWQGVCRAAGWTAGGIGRIWEETLFPALRDYWGGVEAEARWLWNNRFVKAGVAALAAAVVIIVGVIIIVITLPVSLTVGIIAGIATCLAAIATAVYFAVTHPHGFTFLSCFLRCLSAGTAAAATVISMGSLSAAFSASWAEMGLVGALKCAAGNGLLSMLFEGSTSYLFTGHISIQRMIVAFAVGALAGPVSKFVKDAVVSSRLVQAVVVGLSESELSVTARAAVLFLHRSGEVWHMVLTFLQDGATAWGGKAAYLLFSGTFGVGLNLASSMMNHRPITFSSLLASFMTGVIMGGIGLAFGGKGLNGLLSKVGFLKHGLGRVARKMLSKLITKSLHRAIDNSLQSLFKKLFGEKEPAFIKEE
jgi:hypothetical protein